YDSNFVARLNTKVLKHIDSNNPAIISTRQLADNNFNHIFVSNIISDQCFISNKTKEGCQVFPLYVYPDANASIQQTILQNSIRIPNLKIEIVNLIAEKLSLTFTNEKETTPNTFAPIDILDYIYAVLHSPTYREKYKEFLKIDFPRVPYPTNQETFWQLAKLGGELRQIHLLESSVVEKYITQYPVSGNNEVTKIAYTEGKVYINETQHFNNVPEVAWNFYIGGYQPAQKWLKDRKGRKLEFEDILHYQKIIVALTETDRIMKQIDLIGFEN
ncbi:MAG: type ISP restriction/modification enzyme, partial [Vampirovibrionia bacterium]